MVGVYFELSSGIGSSLQVACRAAEASKGAWPSRSRIKQVKSIGSMKTSVPGDLFLAR